MSYWNERKLYGWGTWNEMRDLRFNKVAKYYSEVLDFKEYLGKTVLDLGCGCGLDSIEYALNGACVYAVDPSENSLTIAQKFAGEANVDINVSTEDARSLSFPPGMFDHVHCMGVLHHIPEVDKAVSQIHRVLKSGGTFIAMLYNHDSILYYYSIMYLRGIEQGMFHHMSEDEILCEFSEAKRGCPYTKIYTVDEAKALFSRFSDVEAVVCHNVYDTLDTRKVYFDGPSNLGWHIIVRGRKL